MTTEPAAVSAPTQNKMPLPPSWRSMELRKEDWNLPVTTAVKAFSDTSVVSGLFFCTSDEAEIIKRKTGDFSVITLRSIDETSSKVVFPAVINQKVTSRTGWITSFGNTKASLQATKIPQTVERSALVLFHHHRSHCVDPSEVITPGILMQRALAIVSKVTGKVDPHMVWACKRKEADSRVKTVNVRVPLSCVGQFITEASMVGPLGYFVTLPNFTKDLLPPFKTILLMTTNQEQARHIARSVTASLTFSRHTNKVGLLCLAQFEQKIRQSLGANAVPPLPDGDRYRLTGDILTRTSRHDVFECCKEHGWNITSVSHFTTRPKNSKKRLSNFIVTSTTPPPSRLFWSNDGFFTINPVSSPLPKDSDFPSLNATPMVVDSTTCSNNPYQNSLKQNHPNPLPQQAPQPLNNKVSQALPTQHTNDPLQELKDQIKELSDALAAEKKLSRSLRRDLDSLKSQKQSGNSEKDRRPRANSAITVNDDLRTRDTTRE